MRPAITTVGLLAMLAVSAFSQAQARPFVPPPTEFDIPVVELKSVSERQLTIPDPDWDGAPQCDASGNAYIHVASNISVPVVMKLDVLRDEVVTYQWHDKPRELAFMDFSVSPSGDVWMLGQSTEAYWVVGFGSDGHVGSRTKLDLPSYFWPLRFAVLLEGGFLLSGYYSEHAPADLQGTAFAGIFEASGKLRQRLQDKSEKVVPSEARLALPDGASAIAGPDGNVYLLRPGKIEVVNTSGEIVREVPYSKPDRTAAAQQLWVASNRIAIQFLSAVGAYRRRASFLVLNAENGVPLGMYKPTQGLGYLLCFTGNGFLFDRPRQGRMTLVRADLP